MLAVMSGKIKPTRNPKENAMRVWAVRYPDKKEILSKIKEDFYVFTVFASSEQHVIFASIDYELITYARKADAYKEDAE